MLELDQRPQIRVSVLGLARSGSKVLVSEGYDRVKHETYYRFPGGGVEFYEHSEEALRREFMEELKAEILQAKYLYVDENIFVYEGVKKHELLIIYEVQLPGELCCQEELLLIDNGKPGKAVWIEKQEFLEGNKILYPESVKEWL